MKSWGDTHRDDFNCSAKVWQEDRGADINSVKDDQILPATLVFKLKLLNHEYPSIINNNL